MKKITGLLFSLSLLLTGCGNDVYSSESGQKSYANQIQTAEEDKNSYNLNGLEFYSDIDTAKALMNEYNIISESDEVSDSGQIQTLVEYENVALYDEDCNLTLCFTSLGLIGLNYRSKCSSDEAEEQYQYWLEKVSGIYGEADSSDDIISEWNNDPLGSGTSIFMMNGESYIQISFFSDDTGSEISETERQTEAVTESSSQFTEPTATEYLTEEQKPNGLEFYSDIDTAKELMSGYDIVSEEEKTNDSGELKTYIEYENVELYGKIFELYLSFTNYKLTELSYQIECSEEESLDLYEEILDKIRDVYGKGARGDRVATVWGPNTLGENTEIYVFNDETSISISFRLKDTSF